MTSLLLLSPCGLGNWAPNMGEWRPEPSSLDCGPSSTIMGGNGECTSLLAETTMQERANSIPPQLVRVSHAHVRL